MDAFSLGLLGSVVVVAAVHTAVGPDHYLPFVMLGRARRWSMARTLTVTALCGLGHVASSLLLGGVGLLVGLGVSRLELLEGGRGSLAAWGLVAFGGAYALWGLRRALRSRKGLLPHDHHGHVHIHRHGVATHEHDEEGGSSASFWMLFLIFVLGPCEPLIPLFILPASEGRWGLATAAGLVFGLVTVLTMLAMVGLAYAGARRLPLGPLERWSHVLAGGTIAASGLAILFLGL
jgi:hypothetical protein